MKGILLSICLALSLSAVAPPAYAGDPRFEAFVLAIEHFDPDHEIGLAPDGRAARFVHLALERARKDVPQLTEIHLRTEGLRAGRSKPDRYRALEVKTSRELRRIGSAAKADSVAALVGRLVAGCRFSNRFTEESTGVKGTGVHRSVFYGIDQRFSSWQFKDECDNLETLEWLRSEGIESILHQTISSTSSVIRHGYLFLEFPDLTDLDHAVARIKASDQYAEVFAGFDLRPFPGYLVGDSDTIEAVERAGCEGFRGIALDFSMGWGDCPAGCLDRHHWLVVYECPNPDDTDNWKLVGGLVQEWGNPLPDPDGELELLEESVEEKMEGLEEGM